MKINDGCGTLDRFISCFIYKSNFECCRSIALHGSPIREVFLTDVLNANFSDVVPLHQSTSIVSHHVFLGDIFPKNDPN